MWLYSCVIGSVLHQGVHILLAFDKTFRNLFYFRIGGAKYLMWYWLKPHPCFTLVTDMKAYSGLPASVHLFASIINTEIIRKKFSVKHWVTVGNKAGGRTNRPRIGNNVTNHCNAVVEGDITIENNIVTDSGSDLTKCVPDNCK